MSLCMETTEKHRFLKKLLEVGKYFKIAQVIGDVFAEVFEQFFDTSKFSLDFGKILVDYLKKINTLF
jgi:hypothetical protein